MSYDKNSPEAKKGAFGEAVVATWLEAKGNTVAKPADTFKSGASIVDFHCLDEQGNDFYVEVKTQIARPFGVEDAPCYSIPRSRLDSYARYELEHNAPVMIFIVDPSNGAIYSAYLHDLEPETYIDARKFPFDKRNDALNCTFHYWHREQFDLEGYVSLADHDKLKELFGLVDQPATKENAEPKSLVNKLAAFVNVGKADLIQALLNLRQEKFNREQAQFKEALS